jgi:Ca2+-binding RTX toxin-like protein
MGYSEYLPNPGLAVLGNPVFAPVDSQSLLDRQAILGRSANEFSGSFDTGAANELVFVDSRVEDYQQLITNLKPNQQVIILDAAQDGIAQVSDVLSRNTGISALHLVSHGSEGRINLGSSEFGAYNFGAYAAQLQGWANSLTLDADILIYGCGVATGNVGQDFIRSISQLSGADVAASTNLTGSAALHGDWQLEFNVGEINTALAFSDAALLAYNFVLDTAISTAQIGTLKQGLDKFFATLQTGIDTLVFASKLPLVGEKLKDTADFFTDVKTRINTALVAGDTTAEAVKTALNSALTGLLGGNSFSVVGDEIKFNLGINRSLLEESTPLDFDLGLPALKLKVDGDVKTQLGYDLPLNFVLNKNTGEFYVDSSALDELKIALKVTIPNTTLTGSLAFLKLDVKDSTTTPTLFEGSFLVDIKDLNSDGKLTFAELNSATLTSLFTPQLNAQAKINLDLTTSFGGDAKFPSLKTSFMLDWQFAGAQGITGGSPPSVSFNDVKLNLGDFFDDFVAPIVDVVRDVLKPIRPILDVLETRMPVFSDLPDALKNKFDTIDQDGKITLLEVAKFFNPDNSGIKFITTVKSIDQLVNKIPDGVGDRYISLGSFNLTDNLNGGDIRSLTDLLGVNLANITRSNITNELNQIASDIGITTELGSKVAAFLGNVDDPAFGGEAGDAGAGLAFPILDNPASAFGLFLGQDVNLFTFDAPALRLDFNFDEFFYILGPLGVRLQGNFNARAKFAFGFDTSGLTRFAEDDFADPGLIFDGFYISDRANPDGTGDDVAEVTLSAGIKAFAGINIIVAEAAVGGGITTSNNSSTEGPVLANLHDRGDLDGKVRFSEIIENASDSLLCLFDISGQLIAGLSAYIKVGVDLPFVGFVGWSDSYDLGSTVLLDFSYACGDNPNNPDPILAQSEGSGVLRLNIGAYAADRKHGDIEDNDETFVVEHISTQADGSETLRVLAFGFTKEYTGVRKIYAEGGIGNDVIDLKPGVLAAAELWGDFNPGRNPGRSEFGNDKLFAGDGAAILHGGAGNDELTARIAASQLFGEDGNDKLFGGAGDDTLEGGKGDDRLYGKQGKDTLRGQEDNDILNGDEGDDQLEGGAGSDQLNGGADNDRLRGEAGVDVLVGGSGNDELDGGDDGDYLLGDEGKINALTGQVEFGGGNGQDTLRGGKGRDVMYGQAGNDQLYGGDDDDFMSGGAGEDYLEGNLGNDLIFGDNGQPTLASTPDQGATTQTISVVGPSGPVANPPPLAVSQSQSLTFANGNIVQIASTASPDDGKDEIHGNEGSDVLIGGGADDKIFGEDGTDVALGDAGVIDFKNGQITRIATSDPTVTGNDDIQLGNGADIGLGGSGNDNIAGGTDVANDILIGDNGTIVRNDGTPDANDIFTQSPNTGGTDTIKGGAGNDIIIGGSSGDQLSGEDGNDIVIGDNARINRNSTDIIEEIKTIDPNIGGDDQIQGNLGDDILIGGFGKDTVDGGIGNDILLGDNGRLAYNADGNLTTLDLVTTSDPTQGDRDTLNGLDGNDLIFGGTLGDIINAGSGNDLVFGDHGRVQGNILLSALPLNQTNPPFTFTSIDMQVADLGGDESIQGGAGDDIILGQQGNDVLAGNEGDDDLFGGHNMAEGADGNDTIDGGIGNDVIVGDNASILRGTDTLSPRMRVLSGAVIYDANGNAQVTAAGQANPTGAAARIIKIFDQSTSPTPGTFGNDNLAGGANDDLIFGQMGDDIIQGDSSTATAVSASSASIAAATDGDDYIEGGSGNDLLFGNLGQDDIIGGSSSLFGATTAAQRPDGSDIIFGGAGSAIVRNDLGDTSAVGHARDADVVIGDNGNIFRLVGTNGTSQNRYLSFTYDNYSNTLKIIPRAVQLLDYTSGGGSNDLGGNDVIRGEAGDDILYGMTGNDVIFGDGQDDDIFGGAGSDRLYGGTGEDGILGDDGLILTSRNGQTELLYGVTTTNRQASIRLPGPFVGATTFVSGRLFKAVDLLAWNSGGNDVIYGGLGDDFLHGGAGDDGISGAEAQVAFYNANLITNTNPLGYNPTTRKLSAYDANNPFAKIAGFFLNFDAIDANGQKIEDGKDSIFGDLGNDWLVGGTGADRIFGGFGDDLLNADDNLETNNAQNNRPDSPSFADADFSFGGGGLDVLIANTGADRLFDWVGEFNSYFVPFSGFGEPTVFRAHSPQIRRFLLDLAKSAGGDQSLTEPNGELGLVTPQDPQWQAQNGAPRDPQAGNTAGVLRDTFGQPES